MSERLPSGSTTSNSRAPRRFMAPITCNERPSNGCRSRRIVTKLDMSRRWVVCDGFLRQCQPRLVDPPGRRGQVNAFIGLTEIRIPTVAAGEMVLWTRLIREGPMDVEDVSAVPRL